MNQVTTAINELASNWEDFRRRDTASKSRLEQEIASARDLAQAAKMDAERALIGAEMQRSAPNIDSHARKAFAQYIRSGNSEALAGFESKAISEGSATDGGAALPLQIDRDVAKVLHDLSPLRQLCKVVEVSSQTYRKLVTQKNTASAWVGETDARPATTSPSIQKVDVPIGECYANVVVSQWALDDLAFDVVGMVTEEVGQTFADAETTAFVSGSGTNQPKGFNTHTTTTTGDASRTFGQIQYFPTGVAGGLPASSQATYDHLCDLLYGLRAPYRQNATWLMNSAVASALMKLKDSQNQPLWIPSMASGQPAQLLGRPVVVVESMPALAANSLSIAIADWRRAYQIVDRIGIRSLRDPFTNKPNVNFYFTKRVGGDVIDDQAIKLSKAAVS